MLLTKELIEIKKEFMDLYNPNKVGLNEYSKIKPYVDKILELIEEIDVLWGTADHDSNSTKVMVKDIYEIIKDSINLRFNGKEIRDTDLSRVLRYIFLYSCRIAKVLKINKRLDFNKILETRFNEINDIIKNSTKEYEKQLKEEEERLLKMKQEEEKLLKEDAEEREKLPEIDDSLTEKIDDIEEAPVKEAPVKKAPVKK